MLGAMKKHPFHLEIPFSENNLFLSLPSAGRQRSACSTLLLCANKELSVARACAAAGGKEPLRMLLLLHLKVSHLSPDSLNPNTQI